VETESFGDTFGPKAQRKKPRLDVGSIQELGSVASQVDPYTACDTPGAESSTSAALAAISLANPIPTGDITVPEAPSHAQLLEPIYSKGTSRRIFGELYKVLDSSDVIVHVLDARDPLGTKCNSVIDYLKKEKSHKQIIFVLNKCDLIPTWATVRSFA
jgi:nuclear GTP-binding protein